MVELPGDILLTPQFNRGSVSVDQELMYSMVGYTQKGVTLAAGQGTLLLGTALAQRTQNKKWYSYDPTGAVGVTNEVQTLTEGGSGLTSYTITYSGQTTSSLDDDATASQVQAALEALSNLAPGDVTVTGTTNPIALTLTFGGTLADTNVAAVTTTSTGGSGTVVVATTTAGNSADGVDMARGYLRQSVNTGTDLDSRYDKQGNIVLAGFLKLDVVNAAGNTDSAALVDLNARTDSVLGYLKF
jgi:hypothetical protein